MDIIKSIKIAACVGFVFSLFIGFLEINDGNATLKQLPIYVLEGTFFIGLFGGLFFAPFSMNPQELWENESGMARAKEEYKILLKSMYQEKNSEN